MLTNEFSSAAPPSPMGIYQTLDKSPNGSDENFRLISQRVKLKKRCWKKHIIWNSRTSSVTTYKHCQVQETGRNTIQSFIHSI